MQLLISVAGPADARAALLGGADVIDAKDPRHGALGPVTLHRLAAIRAAVGGARPLSAALGDAADEDAIDRKSTRLNSSHSQISYAVFCLKKKKTGETVPRTRERRQTRG